MAKRKDGKIITINMFKGGVGKTTLTQMLGTLLSDKGYKVLIIDCDPQETLTNKIFRQFEGFDRHKAGSFYDGLVDLSFKNCINEVTENLDIIVGSKKMASFSQLLRDMWKESGLTEEGEKVFWDLFRYIFEADDIRSQYDFILIDTIPTVSDFTDNCYIASDYLLVPTQTEQDSVDNLNSTIYDYTDVAKEINNDLQVMGIVPYLVDNKLKTGKDVLEELKDEYEDLIFENVITDSGVVKTWGREGVKYSIPYGRIAKKMYDNVADEFIARFNEMEKKKA
ncbi:MULTISPECIES: ParA family protein [Vagococcus]|nr:MULTISPECIES: ParA family protein [Vagococcus]